MGGLLEKQGLEHIDNNQEITQNDKNKNHKNKNHQIEEQSTKTIGKAGNEGKSQHQRNGAPKKKKNGKVLIIAKDKYVNLEKKVLELIHEKNPDKEDYDLIHDIITKHSFFTNIKSSRKR